MAGLIDTEKSLLKAESLTVSALCRRRLPVVLVSPELSTFSRSCVHLSYLGGGTRRVALSSTPFIASGFRCCPQVRNKMSENLKEASTYIEQGQVRVGPNVVTDPAFLVRKAFVCIREEGPFP